MPIVKRVICPQRLRRVPPQFSWVDHRLVRDRHICRCSHPALALYLFLVTVCDGQGLSYYSDATLCRMLKLEMGALAQARQELIHGGLIAYQSPLYQVLALDNFQEPLPAPRDIAMAAGAARPSLRAPAPASWVPDSPPPGPQSLGQILRQLLEPNP